jgi:hypothetical protein
MPFALGRPGSSSPTRMRPEISPRPVAILTCRSRDYLAQARCCDGPNVTPPYSNTNSQRPTTIWVKAKCGRYQTVQTDSLGPAAITRRIAVRRWAAYFVDPLLGPRVAQACALPFSPYELPLALLSHFSLGRFFVGFPALDLTE